MKPRGIQPLLHSGSDDLESFLAWSEEMKLDMSESNPLLYQVLGNLAFSKQPIAGGDSFQTKAGQANFLEQTVSTKTVVKAEQKKRENFR